MENQLVSIITPVYNSEKFIEETIKCVENQTYINWEWLLIDDCSTDDSAEIIDKYAKRDKRIKYLKMNRNSGPALTRNFGIEMAEGIYICFLDADDLWDKDKLEKQIKFMKMKKIAFSFTSYEFSDYHGTPLGKKVIAREKITYNQALKNQIIFTSTVMFDIEKINRKLIKMPNLENVEDTATWLQILRNGIIAYGIPYLYSYYRRYESSYSSKKIRNLKKLWNLYRGVENLNVFYAIYCFICKNINAILRRI